MGFGGHGVSSESQGLGSIGTGANAHNSTHGVNSPGRMDSHEAGVRGGWKNASGTPSGYKSGQGEGQHATQRAWNAIDGWHEVSTQASKESLNGGLMSTAFGFRNPGAYARDLGQFHTAQRAKRYNQQANVIGGKLGELTQRVNNGLTDPTDYMSQHKSIVTGGLESLRGLGYNTDDMENAFSPSGFMDTFSSMFGGKPDKVDTYAGLAQDYLDQGLLEQDDFGNLNVTNKGGFVGAAGPLSNFAPGLGNIMGGISGAALGMGAKTGVDYFADENPHKNATRLAGVINTAAPFAGQAASTLMGFAPGLGLLDTFGYAKDLDNLGIAPGGKSYFGRDPYTGRIETTNQGVIDGMIDRAENLATPGEMSESYTANVNPTTPYSWPTAESTNQQTAGEQPWSWEQWKNYFS